MKVAQETAELISFSWTCGLKYLTNQCMNTAAHYTRLFRQHLLFFLLCCLFGVLKPASSIKKHMRLEIINQNSQRWSRPEIHSVDVGYIAGLFKCLVYSVFNNLQPVCNNVIAAGFRLKKTKLRQVAHEAVHHSLVIGHMLRQICRLFFFPLLGLGCCVAKPPVAYGALCVSIPARLQPFYRSDPNPVKGVWACCPQEGFYRACLRGTNQNWLSVIWFRYLSSGGTKSWFLSPQEASWCPIKQTKEETFNMEGKPRVVTRAGSPQQEMSPRSAGSTFACFIWKQLLLLVVIFFPPSFYYQVANSCGPFRCPSDVTEVLHEHSQSPDTLVNETASNWSQQ